MNKYMDAKKVGALNDDQLKVVTKKWFDRFCNVYIGNKQSIFEDLLREEPKYVHVNARWKKEFLLAINELKNRNIDTTFIYKD